MIKVILEIRLRERLQTEKEIQILETSKPTVDGFCQ